MMELELELVMELELEMEMVMVVVVLVDFPTNFPQLLVYPLLELGTFSYETGKI